MYHYDSINGRIKAVDNQIIEQVIPYADLIEELDKIPGIDHVLAVGILAESSNLKSQKKFSRKKNIHHPVI